IGIVYLSEDEDAEETQRLVEERGARCLSIRGDVTKPDFAQRAVAEMVHAFGPRIDVLVNNAAAQWPQSRIEDISYEQLDRTFKTNIYAYFLFAQAALPQMESGASIINTTSVTAYRGSGHLIDYASTKGAITAFTRSLAQALAERGIRVNGVAPGPIWTPLIQI